MNVLVIPNRLPGIFKHPISKAPIIENRSGYLNLLTIGKIIFIVNNVIRNHNAPPGSMNSLPPPLPVMTMEYIFQSIQNRKYGIINRLNDFSGSSGPIFEKYPATKKKIGK